MVSVRLLVRMSDARWRGPSRRPRSQNSLRGRMAFVYDEARKHSPSGSLPARAIELPIMACLIGMWRNYRSPTRSEGVPRSTRDGALSAEVWPD
jgi:hypothetical protein